MTQENTIATDATVTETTTEEVVENTVEETVEETSDGTLATTEETPKVEEKVIPESYEFKFPEGWEANDEMVGEFSTLGKELKLSQEEAQKLVDFHSKWTDSLNQENEKAFTDLRADWAKQSKEDKEIGGKNFDANMGVVREAIKMFGDDDLKQVLNLTAVGNHPSFLRFCYKIGQQLKEDKVHTGSNPEGQMRDFALQLYPSMKDLKGK